MRQSYTQHWGNKDGKRLRISQYADENLNREILEAYRRAGYVISITEDWWDEDD